MRSSGYSEAMDNLAYQHERAGRLTLAVVYVLRAVLAVLREIRDAMPNPTDRKDETQ